MCRDFRDALRSRAVVRPSHTGLAAEGFHRLDDAFIIGCDNHTASSLGHFGALIDSLDHGLAGQRNQRFAGQPRRAEACGNNDDHLWFCRSHATESRTFGNVWALSPFVA